MKDKFFSSDEIGLLVHSYNNYLSGIMGYSELALLECEDEDVKARIESGLISGREAVDFGLQLLSCVSRAKTQSKIYSVNQLLRPFIQSNDLVLDDKQTVPAKIKVDSTWFLKCLQMLVNFVTKMQSKDANGKTNFPHLILTVDKQSLVMQLTGEGIQLLPEQEKLLFQPFYSSRHLTGDKSLGLAVVEGFILQMSGSIEWHNEQGFEITLPLAEE